MSIQSYRFQAMGCPCEVLLAGTNSSEGEAQLAVAVREAERIEQKYSRYRSGTIVERINTSQGAAVEVDEETAALLDYAAQSYELSGGLFDITTGALRHGADVRRVGWEKVEWARPRLRMPAGFEIDFGGICKEYAADRILG